MSDLLRHLNDLNIEIDESTVSPEGFTTMLKRIDAGTISRRSAKKVLMDMMKEGKHPDEIIEEDGHHRIGDIEELKKVANEVIQENQKATEDAIQDDSAINYLVGQVMKKTRGTADPEITFQIIEEIIITLRKKSD